MRDKARAAGVIFRPHVKTHKTIDGARMQHAGGYGPITVSTLAEAEFFADAGFRDITYAVPIAPDKLQRAAALSKRVERLNILIDSEVTLRAVEQLGQPFDVYLKVDCGYHRAGVDPDNPDSLALARAMLRSQVVRLEGLLTHAGHSYHARSADDVRRIAAEESACLTRFRALDADLSPVVRSVGSTPTASVVDAFSEVDEVRPGNYVFYDAFQAAIGSCTLDDVAVSVLATVIGSYPDRHEAIIDAGALALSKDLGTGSDFGLVCDLDLRPLPLKLVSLSQEHGKIEGASHLPVGTKLRIIPNHSCLTAAMFDRYHIIERGRVVDEWKPVRGW
jgi:D-serine deaminase-like pyridoxal phosphate-dependent protein